MSDLISMLAEGIVKITFTKKDGEQRVMRATRSGKLIPEDMAPKGGKAVPDHSVQVRVFDVDLDEWRSYKPDNVVSFEKE